MPVLNIPYIDDSGVIEPMSAAWTCTGYRELRKRDGQITSPALIQYGLNPAVADIVRPIEIRAYNAADSDHTPKLKVGKLFTLQHKAKKLASETMNDDIGRLLNPVFSR